MQLIRDLQARKAPLRRPVVSLEFLPLKKGQGDPTISPCQEGRDVNWNHCHVD